MATETHIALREVILEEVMLVPVPYLETADKRRVQDETCNPIRDEYGRIIYDD